MFPVFAARASTVYPYFAPRVLPTSYRKVAPTLATTRSLATASRLLDVTKLDHDNVRDLWARYQKATHQLERRAIANTLIREMAVHSDAGCVAPK